MLDEYFHAIPWLNQILRISPYVTLAWVRSAPSNRIINRFNSHSELTIGGEQLLSERIRTIRVLIAGSKSPIAFVTAAILILSMFLDSVTLIWMVGSFSAVFGLGARPLIRDYLHGIGYIFENEFTAGEKIQLPGLYPVEGMVEANCL